MDPNDPDNPSGTPVVDPEPMPDDPEPTPVEPEGDIPSDMQSELDELNHKLLVFDVRDEINSKKNLVKLRSVVPEPVPEWRRFKFIQRFILRLKNADKVEKADIATWLIFFMSCIVVLITLFNNQVNAQTAAYLNVICGVISFGGTALSNKYSITNSVPSSAFTYSVGQINPKTSSTQQNITDSVNPVETAVTEDDAC